MCVWSGLSCPVVCPVLSSWPVIVIMSLSDMSGMTGGSVYGVSIVQGTWAGDERGRP
jgi:hypothetical protein